MSDPPAQSLSKQMSRLNLETNPAPASEKLATQQEDIKKKKKKSKKKGKNKPSGFEEFFAEPPVTPDEAILEAALYDRRKPAAERLEICVQRYRHKRKFDPTRVSLFNAYLSLGGVQTGQKMFQGNDPTQLKDQTAEEIMAATAMDFINDKDDLEWVVDFERVARAFLSYKMLYVMGHSDSDVTAIGVNVIRNFLNYVDHHDVVPESHDSLDAARAICDLAETEIEQCRLVSNDLPGPFNRSCSIIFGGIYSRYCVNGLWRDSQAVQYDPKDALELYIDSIRHRAVPQYKGGHVQVIRSDYVLMEVITLEFPCEGTLLSELGELTVKLIDEPNDEDLKPVRTKFDDLQARSVKIKILLEKKTLNYCFPGIKIEAKLYELDNGLYYFDTVTGVFCSFYLRMDVGGGSDTEDSTM